MADSSESAPVGARRDDSSQNFATSILEVARPQPGELRIVDLDRQTDVAFSFGLDDARIIALDVDIIIAFTDGGKLLLPNLGLLATSLTPPAVRFAGRPVTWEHVFSGITEVAIGEPTATLSNIGRDQEGRKENDTPEPKTDSVVTPPIQPAPTARIQAARSDDGAGAVMAESFVAKSQPLEAPKPVSLGSAGTSTKFSELNTNIGNGYYVVAGLSVDLGATLLNNSTAADSVLNSDGSRTIYYAPGGAGSDNSSTYAAQSSARMAPVSATASNDTIYLDNPNLVPAGYAYRKVELVLDSQTQGFEVVRVSIRNLPAGVILNGFTPVNGAYEIPVTDVTTGKIEFGLLYALPGVASSRDANGFYGFFDLDVTSTAANSKGDYRDLSTTITFGVRDVANAGDMEFSNASGKVNILWANPPGAIVDAGAGDDIIYSSSGADTITGGDGRDLVSYISSSGPVTVDLSLTTPLGAYAKGDIFLDSIEDVAGSSYADILTGNAVANVFRTSGGADTIDGRAGSDTVDFSTSANGVTVDLSNYGAKSGGDAQGVVLRNIENVTGSSERSNILGGNYADNRLEGGASNDTFFGSAGRDTYIGGDGFNLLDYSRFTQGVSLDMQSTVALLQNIEKIIGSNFGDTFAGDATDNVFAGGSGADSMIGRGGNDTLMGGGGGDTLRDEGGSDSYFGGSGNDLFIAATSFVPGYQFDGSDGYDTIDFSDFAPATNPILHVQLFTDGSGRYDWPGSAFVGNFANMEAVVGSKYADNLIDGNVWVNHLVGGDSSDTLSGLGGADTISGGAGNDSLAGGGDAGDTADYRNATAALVVTMADGDPYTARVGSNETDTLSGFVNILGSNFDDRIYGDSQSSLLYGYGGDDTMAPGSGDDTIDGGDGKDVVDLSYLGTEAVSIAVSSSYVIAPAGGQQFLAVNFEGVLGAAGNDTLVADVDHPGYIGGGGGNDLLISNGMAGGATFDGGVGVDALDLRDYSEGISVNLSSGADATLSVGGETGIVRNIEILNGGSGNDTITAIADVVTHTLFGNGGDDSLVGGTSDALFGGSGNDTIVGGAGNDVLDGEIGDDSLSGGSGNDRFTDSAGADRFDGGDGAADSVSYDTRSVGVSVTYRNGVTASVFVAPGEVDAIVNIENVAGGSGNDTISAAGDLVAHSFSGLGGDDSLVGGAGADTLFGGAGADTILAGTGSESLDGGDDRDALDYTANPGGLTVAFSGQGAGAVTAGSKYDTFANIEIFIASGEADSITGGVGADTILSGGGDDAVTGGLGNDSLDGGAGAGDLVDYASRSESISVVLSASTVSTLALSNGEIDVIVNFENVAGGGGNDTISAADDLLAHVISGNGGDDSLIGGAANDALSGGAGNDTFVGGLGSDVIDGGSGLSDLLSYAGRSADISVIFQPSGTTSINIGGGEIDTIVNVENITGGSGNDTLSALGDTLAHTLSGGSGDDSLIGGSNADSLFGGAGQDAFVASAGNDKVDGGADIDRMSFAGQPGSVSFAAGSDSAITATLFAADGAITGEQVLRNVEAFKGSAGSDTLVGLSGAETMDGGGGSDSLVGDARDVLTYAEFTGVSVDLKAGAGTDGAGNTDTLTGFAYVVGASAGDSTLFGDDADNTLVGGARNDLFKGRLGADSFFGNGGVDTLDFSERTAGFSAALGSSGSIDVAAGETDRYDGVSRFNLTSGSDTILASSIDGLFVDGGAGNDSFTAGSGGANTFDGGSGTSDVISYGDSAFASVTANLSTTGSFATVSLASGGVRLDLLANFEGMTGASGSDSLVGDAATDNTFFASGGNDTFDGGAGGSDVVDYSTVTGVSALSVDLSAANPFATLFGADGALLKADRLINIEGVRGLGTTGTATFIGGALSESLAGGLGADSIAGGAGSDTISGGRGNDVLYGNIQGVTADAGDILDYSYTNGSTVSILGLTYNMGATLSTVTISTAGSPDIDVVGRFRNVVATSGDDSIVTDSNPNTVSLGAGNDTTTGGASDSLIGGAGNDILDYSATTLSVTATLNGATAATVRVNGSNNAVFREFEGLIGGSAADALSGDTGANTLDGGSGNDSLNGAGGNDSLFGGQGIDSLLGGLGADTLSGGAGADILDGGNDLDVLSYADATAAVTLTLAGATAATATIGAEADTVRNFEILLGSSFNDVLGSGLAGETIDGGGADDTLRGGGGSNSLFGGQGNDWIYADTSTGSDTIDGGDGIDTIDFSNYSIGVSVSLGVNGGIAVTGGRTITLVNIENIFGGSGNDTLVGNQNNNGLTGNDGDDSLSGVGGDDLLEGGAGNDTLRGGTGSNTLRPGTGTNDVILFDDLTEGFNTAFDQSLPRVSGTDYGDTISGSTTNAFSFSGAGGNDSLVGNVSDDSLDGGDNDDTISGAGGNDTLVGGFGDDQLDGGDGVADLMDYTGRSVNISVAFGSGAMASVRVFQGAGETDTIVNIENISGGSGNDTISAAGDSVAHLLSGNGGDDCLIGGLQADTLLGGVGNNTMFGGAGNDRVVSIGGGIADGEAGTDMLDLSGYGSAFMSLDPDGLAYSLSYAIGLSESGLLKVINFENLIGGAGNDTLLGASTNDSVTGAAGNDSIGGGAGNDTLLGGSGNDTLFGGLGNDTLDGGANAGDFANFSDASAAISVVMATSAALTTITLSGGEIDRIVNIENLIGGAFNDTLASATTDTTAHYFVGGDGNDSLLGGAGNDTLDGGLGADTMTGGAGNDLFFADNADSISDASGTNDGVIATSTTFDLGFGVSATAIENLYYAGSGDFVGSGNNVANIIQGGSGNDCLLGLTGNDTLDGGAGSDTLDGGINPDLLTGGAGNDSIFGGPGTANDTLIGGDGNDTLAPDGGVDSIDGGEGFDVLDYTTRGTAAITASIGGATSAYTLTISGLVQSVANIEVFLSAGGNDCLIGSADTETISGAAGNDTLDGGSNNDSLSGGLGNDSLVGGLGNDAIDGGAGNDTVVGGLGNDTVDGGDNVDTVDYSTRAASAPISMTLGAGGLYTVSVAGGEIDVIQNFENILGGAGDDTLLGSASGGLLTSGLGNDSLMGGALASSLSGGGGDDTIVNGSSADTIDGGANNDLLVLSSRTAGITGVLNGATATSLTIGLEVDRLTNIEHLALGSGDDSISALDSFAHSISADGGADTLLTLGGDDTLDGGAGADSLSGGAGNDLYVMDSAGDVIVDASGVDSLQTSLTSVSLLSFVTNGVASIENLAYTGSADFTGIGSASNNILAGGGGNDLLSAGLGADTLSGGLGRDTLDGGRGADSLSGGAGNDSLTGGGGADTISGGAGDDTLTASTESSYSIAINTSPNPAATADFTEYDLDKDGDGRVEFTLAFTLKASDDPTSSSGANLIGILTSIPGGTPGEQLASFGLDSGGLTLSGAAGNGVAAGTDTNIRDGLSHTYAVSFSSTGDDVSGSTVMVVYRDGVLVWEATFGPGAGSAFGQYLKQIQIPAGSAYGSIWDDVTLWASKLDATQLAAASLGSAVGNPIARYTFENGSLKNTVSDSYDLVQANANSASIITTGGASLSGGDGSDSILGSAASDTLSGGLGADTINGGGGNNVVDYTYLTTQTSFAIPNLNVTVGAGPLTLTLGVGDVDVLTNFEGILASSGNDTLIGDDGDNYFSGGAGNDLMVGAGGNDTIDYSYVTDAAQGVSINLSDTAATLTINGGAGDVDTIVGFENAVGGAGADVLVGGAGANYLSGGAGNDSLFGGAGNDTFVGGLGNDTMDGGADAADLLDLGTRTEGLTVQLAGASFASVVLGGGEVDLVANIENVAGGSGADCLLGDSAANVIIGGGGNDTLSGGFGNDTLMGGGAAGDFVNYTYATAGVSLSLSRGGPTTATVGAGDVDVLYGFTGAVGSSFNDSMVGDNNANFLSGGAGSDTLGASGGADTLDGGSGIDVVTLNGGSQRITVSSSGTVVYGGSSLINIEGMMGGSSNETIIGDSLTNIIGGGGGNDSLDGRGGSDFISYAYAATAVSVNLDTNNAVTILVGAGDIDTIVNFENVIGTSGADTLVGDGFGNTMRGGLGNDTMNGSTGSDTVDYSYTTTGISLAIASTFVASIGVGDVDTLANFENVIGGSGNDTLTGDTGVNTLSGGAGNDLLGLSSGLLDAFDGGSGIDTLDATSATAAISLSLGSVAAPGSYALTGGSSTYVLNIENILGSGNSDTLAGDAGANSIFGAAGSDLIIAGGGNDTLDGGTGNDTIDYSALNATQSLVVTAINATSWAASVYVGGVLSEVDTISNFEAINGSAFNDSLQTGGGNELFVGGLGNDTIDGGSNSGGGDYVDYSYSSSTVGISSIFGSASTFTISLGVDDIDRLVNVEGIIGGAAGNDTLYGDGNANSLTGNAGDDSLFGGAGNDTLRGGLGNDVLDGGSSSDTADYSTRTLGVTVQLNGTGTVTATLGAGEFDRLVNIEGILSGSGDDCLIGDLSNNTIVGLAGNDTIVGSLGNDSMSASSSSTSLLDYSGMTAGARFDFDPATGVTVTIGAKRDVIRDFTNFILTGFADSMSSSDSGANFIVGGAGNDTINGGGGADTIDGGAGVDVYSRSGGGNFDTTIDLRQTTVTHGSARFINFEGFIGTGGDETIIGNASDNFFSGMGGFDSIDGGAGSDTVDYGYLAFGSRRLVLTTGVVSISLNSGDSDRLINVENIYGAQGVDTIIDSAGTDNVFRGNDSNDWLDGGDGNDTVDYGYVNATGMSIVLDGSNIVRASVVSGDVDFIVNFENINGGGGSDTLTGDGLDNVLRGAGGADRLNGGVGFDTLQGGSGADQLDGGDDNDIADYSYATTGVSVDLGSAATVAASVSATDIDTLTNMEGVIGGSGADYLAGTGGANFLSGGLGDDTLFGGGAGSDTLFGDGGADLILFNRTDFAGMRIDGGAGSDTLQFQSSGTYAGADLSVAITNVEILDFTKTGADVTATLTSDDIKALGLSALDRDLTIRMDAGDALSIDGVDQPMGAIGSRINLTYDVGGGQSVALHIITSSPT